MIFLVGLSTLLNIPIMFQVATGVTLDANWRWIHGKDGYENCYTGNQWDQSYCPDAATCTENCLLGRTPLPPASALSFSIKKKRFVV